VILREMFEPDVVRATTVRYLVASTAKNSNGALQGGPCVNQTPLSDGEKTTA